MKGNIIVTVIQSIIIVGALSVLVVLIYGVMWLMGVVE